VKVCGQSEFDFLHCNAVVLCRKNKINAAIKCSALFYCSIYFIADVVLCAIK